MQLAARTTGEPTGHPTEPRPTVSVRQVARSPRMVGLLILFLAAAAVCGRLGMWQLDRAEIRGAAAEQQRSAEVAAEAPVPIAEVLAPQSTFDGALVGRRVLATGTYQADDQLLVADRVHDGRTGWLVLTPLRVTEGEGAGAVLPVVRGWVEDADAARSAGVLDVPAGTVRVTGYLQAGEDSRQVDGTLPAGTTDSISSAELLTAWGGPIWTGYAVLSVADPVQDDGIALLDPPTRASTGLNIQNLAYSAEWWIFGGFAVLLWVRMLRDEVRRRRGEDPLGLGE